MAANRERYGLDADQVGLDVRDEAAHLQLFVYLTMAVVYGIVEAGVVDDLQLGRHAVRLEYLDGHLVERLVVDAIDRVVQRRVRVLDAVRRNVDLTRVRVGYFLLSSRRAARARRIRRRRRRRRSRRRRVEADAPLRRIQMGDVVRCLK